MPWCLPAYRLVTGHLNKMLSLPDSWYQPVGHFHLLLQERIPVLNREQLGQRRARQVGHRKYPKLAYSFGAVLIQDRNGSGVKVVEEEDANNTSPIETSSQASVASTPESIAAVIDVQGDREKATGIRHAFIFRVRLEILALYLGYLFKEYTNRKDCRSDDERDRLEGLLGSRRGPGPNGKHGIYGIEDGVEGCNHESRDHGHLLL